MADVTPISITVISQLTSKRSRQEVFSRIVFRRNLTATIVPSIPGARKTIVKRRARGRRETQVMFLRGHMDSPWEVPPGPSGVDLGAMMYPGSRAFGGRLPADAVLPGRGEKSRLIVMKGS